MARKKTHIPLLFYLDTGQYPSSEAGLKSLIEAPANMKDWKGPYLKRDQGLLDPWGKEFQYRVPGEHGAYDLYSLGRDGSAEGEGENKDIKNW